MEKTSARNIKGTSGKKENSYGKNQTKGPRRKSVIRLSKIKYDLKQLKFTYCKTL